MMIQGRGSRKGFDWVPTVFCHKMTLMTDLSDSEDEEIVFMTADERLKSKPDHKEQSDPGDTKYTTQDVASIAKLLEEDGIPCFVAGLSALRYYGAALVQSVNILFFYKAGI